MATTPDLFIGKEPVTFDFDGTPVFVGPTIVVRAGHPIMRGREHLFTPLVVHFDLPEPEDLEQKPPPSKSRTTAAKQGS